MAKGETQGATILRGEAIEEESQVLVDVSSVHKVVEISNAHRALQFTEAEHHPIGSHQRRAGQLNKQTGKGAGQPSGSGFQGLEAVKRR
ncbi:MAG: hypothetical protein WCK64_07530 [Synechococcaceae cyanobacterium ELA445]